jgi:hypothetical protein
MSRIEEAKRKIERLSDDEVLQINTEETTRYLVTKHQLPLIVKDANRSITTELVERRSVENDNGELFIRKWSAIRICYPVKHCERIEESLQYTPRTMISLEALEDYAEGSIILEVAMIEYRDDTSYEERAKIKTGDLEGNIVLKNKEIQEGNNLMVDELTRFIENMKLAIGKDRAKSEKVATLSRKEKDEGDDCNDDKHERTANDDRSDSLNPNNPAYDAARDNRADQLNPNNPRYQGD